MKLSYFLEIFLQRSYMKDCVLQWAMLPKCHNTEKSGTDETFIGKQCL